MYFLLALNFTENSKLQFNEFLNLKKKSIVTKFQNCLLMKYLMENGLNEGILVGKVLKKIEKE